MKLAGQVLLACVLLAIVKAALALLLVVLGIGFLWFTATRPRETAALFVLALVAALLRDHGAAFVCFLGFALVASAVRCEVTHRTDGSAPSPSCDPDGQERGPAGE